MSTPPNRLPHFPGLDGLRGVAVIVVLLFHGGFSWAVGGYLGVSTFFTLSGFLITSLLLAERTITRTVDVRSVLGAPDPPSHAGRGGRADPGRAVRPLRRHGGPAAQPGRRRGRARWPTWPTGTSSSPTSPTPTCSPGPRRCSTSGAWPSRSSSTWCSRWSASWLLAKLALEPQSGGRALRGPHGRVAVHHAVPGLLPRPHLLRHRDPLVRAAGRLPAGGGSSTAAGSPGVWPGRVRAAPPWPWPARSPWPSASCLWARTPQTTDWLYRGGLSAYSGLSVLIILATIIPFGPVAALLSTAALRRVGMLSYGIYVYHWPIFLWVGALHRGSGHWPRFGVGGGHHLGGGRAAPTTSSRCPIRRGELPFGLSARAGPARFNLAWSIPVAFLLVGVGALAVTAAAPPPAVRLRRRPAHARPPGCGQASGQGGQDRHRPTRPLRCRWPRWPPSAIRPRWWSGSGINDASATYRGGRGGQRRGLGRVRARHRWGLPLDGRPDLRRAHPARVQRLAHHLRPGHQPEPTRSGRGARRPVGRDGPQPGRRHQVAQLRRSRSTTGGSCPRWCRR